VPKDNVAHGDWDPKAETVMPLLGMLYTGTLKSCVAEAVEVHRPQPVAASVDRVAVAPSI
jgi:hypothetical protein